MSRQNSIGLVGTLERVLASGAAIFLLLGAGMALLLALSDPNAPARCIAGAAEGWIDTVLCLNRAGFGLPLRLILGGIGAGLFAALLTSLRSRAEDRELSHTIHAVLAASAEAQQQRETA